MCLIKNCPSSLSVPSDANSSSIACGFPPAATYAVLISLHSLASPPLLLMVSDRTHSQSCCMIWLHPSSEVGMVITLVVIA